MIVSLSLKRFLRSGSRVSLLAAGIVALAANTSGQVRATPVWPESETAASAVFNTVRKNPLELRAFLVRMPKGADLHIHLTGEVYAESWIRLGVSDKLCFDVDKLTFVANQASESDPTDKPSCHDRSVPIANALSDQHLYDRIVDALSMRAFVPSEADSGHDHFFATFSKFSPATRAHVAEELDEVATRAAAQNEQYLEIMDTPDFSHTSALAEKIGWQPDLASFRDQLLAAGVRDDVTVARKEFDGAETRRREIERCGGPQPSSACGVQVRYLYQALRGLPKEIVFAQLVLAFEVAAVDPNVVGVNFVMPEDGYISMADNALQMKMFDFLHRQYPNVHISLHAGELAPGLVTYEGLCCHVQRALEDGHAERIGHGVDIMYETNPYDLLNRMAAKHVMVEINLTSNDLILGVAGANHPLPIYRAYGVPVALSTDDEGVSRIDLTHEFERAVESYNLTYADLKTMVRTSLEHSFLPGTSLWRERDSFRRPVEPCSFDKPGAKSVTSMCSDFLKSSEKARQQWELEERFAAFESSFQ